MRSDPEVVEVPPRITVRELSLALGTPMQDIVRALMGIGVVKTATQALTDFEMQAVAHDLGRIVVIAGGASRSVWDAPHASHAPMVYKLRLCLPDGTERQNSSLTTLRPRSAGDVLNVPLGPDGRSRPGRGFLWRVAALEDEGKTLVLGFERANPDGDA